MDRQTAEGDQGAPTEGLLPEQRQVDTWRTDGQTGGQTDRLGRSGSANRRPAPRAVAGRRLEDRQTAEGDRGAQTEGLLPEQRQVDAWRTDGQTGGQTDSRGRSGSANRRPAPRAAAGRRLEDRWTDGWTDSRGRSGSANRRPAPRAAAGRRLEDRRTDGWTDRQPREIRERQQKACSQSSGR